MTNKIFTLNRKRVVQLVHAKCNHSSDLSILTASELQRHSHHLMFASMADVTMLASLWIIMTLLTTTTARDSHVPKCEGPRAARISQGARGLPCTCYDNTFHQLVGTEARQLHDVCFRRFAQHLCRTHYVPIQTSCSPQCLVWRWSTEVRTISCLPEKGVTDFSFANSWHEIGTITCLPQLVSWYLFCADLNHLVFTVTGATLECVACTSEKRACLCCNGFADRSAQDIHAFAKNFGDGGKRQTWSTYACIYVAQTCWMVLATIRDQTSPHCWHRHVLMFASIKTPWTPATVAILRNGCWRSFMIMPHMIVHNGFMCVSVVPTRFLPVIAHNAAKCGQEGHGSVQVFAIIVSMLRIAVCQRWLRSSLRCSASLSLHDFQRAGFKILHAGSGRDRMPRIMFVNFHVHAMNVTICAEITGHASCCDFASPRHERDDPSLEDVLQITPDT